MAVARRRTDVGGERRGEEVVGQIEHVEIIVDFGTVLALTIFGGDAAEDHELGRLEKVQRVEGSWLGVLAHEGVDCPCVRLQVEHVELVVLHLSRRVAQENEPAVQQCLVLARDLHKGMSPSRFGNSPVLPLLGPDSAWQFSGLRGFEGHARVIKAP